MRSRSTAAVALLALAVIACGESAGTGMDPASSGPATSSSDNARPQTQRPAPTPRVKRAKCAPTAPNCRAATGRVVYVERVDPDRDGDAHLVLASTDNITAPGISVVDIRADLRPNPLPRTGDLVSAAGPVYRGSYGQRQIEATDVQVARTPQSGR